MLLTVSSHTLSVNLSLGITSSENNLHTIMVRQEAPGSQRCRAFWLMSASFLFTFVCPSVTDFCATHTHRQSLAFVDSIHALCHLSATFSFPWRRELRADKILPLKFIWFVRTDVMWMIYVSMCLATQDCPYLVEWYVADPRDCDVTKCEWHSSVSVSAVTVPLFNALSP